MRIEVVEGPDIFAITDVWDTLVESTGASFFQSRKWCEPWWRILAEEGDVAGALVLGDSQQVLGLGLVAELDVPVIGRLGWMAPSVVPLGALVGSADHMQVLAAPGPTYHATVEALVDWMRHWRPRRSFMFPSAPRHSLEQFVLGDLRAVARAECPRAVIPHGASWDDIRSQWSKNRRKKLRQKAEGFEQAGGSFTWLTDPSDVVQSLDIVRSLHRERWSSRGRRTQFGWSDTRKNFLESVVRANGPGLAWIQLAKIGEEVVGGLVGFVLGGRLHVYQSGWKPSYAHLSIGLVQYAEAFRQSVIQGCFEFDMCRGVDAYKMRFATDVVSEVTLLQTQAMRGAMLSIAAKRWGSTLVLKEEDSDGD